VLLVAPGQLPKTPSGKRQRAACRTQYLEGRFEPA
jgi:acyl-CoA synthetase (AMP-forming)/AMP-acid ligase II